MLQIKLFAVFGIFTSVMCWVFAYILFRVGRSSSAARQLALLLVVEGFTLISGLNTEYLLPAAALESNWYPSLAMSRDIVHLLGDCTMLALYPIFLATVMDTRLTRLFAKNPQRIVLAITAFVLFLVVISSVIFNRFLNTAIIALYLSMTLLFGYALVVSIHSWRNAPKGINRTRAGIFAIAFGFRDVCWGIIYAHGIYLILSGSTFDPPVMPLIYALGTFFAIPIISYGVLRTQLFDIDLKIRWTIKQSTLAAIIITLIFLVSEGADRMLSSELGDFAGLFAAAVLVFFLTPLQSFAERIANAAMPNTRPTAQYEAHRKMQVYEAAAEEALQDADISQKERSLLAHLRDSLGISPADAEAIERDIEARKSGSTQGQLSATIATE